MAEVEARWTAAQRENGSEEDRGVRAEGQAEATA